MAKGWYGHRQQHSMASKGVRTGNLKKFKAKGEAYNPYAGIEEFDISEHYWGLELIDGEIRLRLGNWTDAGWYWSGEEDQFAGYLIRLAGSRIDRDEIISILERNGVDFEDFKEIILESARSGDGIYMITGDNAKWHFGQDGEREYDIIRYDLKEYHELSDKDIEEFEDYYWTHMESNSTDFDSFEESEYYDDLKGEIVSAVENADSWWDVLSNLEDLREIGDESSWEFSDNAVREDVYEKFAEWNETARWDKEVDEGLPDDYTIGKMVERFGRTGAMKKIHENYWDVETFDEAKKIVVKFESEAIPKGRRPIEKEQKRLKEF